MHSRMAFFVLLLQLAGALRAEEAVLPIIDMHLHTKPPGEFLPGPPFPFECALPGVFPSTTEAAQSGSLFQYMQARKAVCPMPLGPVETEEALVAETTKRLERYNIYAVATLAPDKVALWRKGAPGRIIPAGGSEQLTDVDAEEIRARHERGDLAVLAEISSQYQGLAPNDQALAPFWALAEELDLPVGIHMGPSAPGVPAMGFSSYRAKLSSPLLLEEVLLRHPGLRVYVMHAGWPMLDDTLHMLYSYPQLYVDVAVIDWVIPRAEFHRYLRRLVEAGFANRILFGSDQMIWPEAIDVAVDSIEAAGFLTEEQKRDIFYNNAVRFLRLTDEEVAAHRAP